MSNDSECMVMSVRECGGGRVEGVIALHTLKFIIVNECKDDSKMI
jgi:hypothetical protein